MRYRRKYELTFPYGDKPQHTWIIEGAKGAMHFHVRGYEIQGSVSWSAGLETHYRSPPEYMKDNPPSQNHCWILECPCWHDGTSLYASESYVPLIQRNLEDGRFDEFTHNMIFNKMESDADNNFGEKEQL